MNSPMPHDALLRTLDAAPSAPTEIEHQRAAVTLERIITTTAPVMSDASDTSVRPRTIGGRRLRWALVPTAALALAGALIVAPAPGPAPSAYASWTPASFTPDPPSLALADAACRGDLRRYWGDRTDPSFIDVDRAGTDLADRRGEFVAIVYSTPENTATCIVHNPRGSDEAEVSSLSGSSTPGPGALVPADGIYPGGIFEDQGSEPTGIARLFDRTPHFRGAVVSGTVGRDVTGLTIRAGTFTIEATVAEGRYGAWWPGPAMKCGPQENGVLRCDSITTYDLHLTDGSTITDAQPVIPH